MIHRLITMKSSVKSDWNLFFSLYNKRKRIKIGDVKILFVAKKFSFQPNLISGGFILKTHTLFLSVLQSTKFQILELSQSLHPNMMGPNHSK